MQARIYKTIYQNEKMQRGETAGTFATDTGEQETNVINVYPQVRGQVIDGFGGAITEAVGYTLQQLPEEQVQQVFEACFGPEGLGYQMLRTHMDSCDFSLGNYSAAEKEADITEDQLSFAHDETYIIPYIRMAETAAGRKLPVMMTPWSPPAFMKTNENRNNGGRLKREYYQMWAEYIVRYIRQYMEWGICIDKLSVQNEPNAVQTWDSCIFAPHEEKQFLKDYLYPALKAAGLEQTGIYIWDHNKERIYDRALQVIDEETGDMVEGIAFHWYSGDHFEAVKLVHDQYPDKKLLFSEGCIEYSRFDGASQLHNAQMYAHDMIGNFNSGMNTFIDWNIVLDEKGGPNHVGNYCEAPIICDTVHGSFEKKLSFYYIGHFSRFIKSGAEQIASTRYTDQLDVLAAENPDGQIVTVVLNRSGRSQEVYLRLNGQIMPMQLEADSIATIVI